MNQEALQELCDGQSASHGTDLHCLEWFVCSHLFLLDFKWNLNGPLITAPWQANV